MTTTLARAALSAALVLALTPGAAHADFLVAPYLAWTRNPDTERWVVGGGATAEITRGWLVAGGDVGYASGFFDPPDDALDLIASSHVLTVTGHAGVTRPAGDVSLRVRPYVTGGFGWMRQQARDREGLAAVTRSDPALHIGGGADLMITDYLGVRADLRHFRSLRDPYETPDPIVADLERVKFWRVSVGAVLRFGYE
jgi:hypothetical protein